MFLITLKTESEIELIARACEIVADVLDGIEGQAHPGVSTLQLDKWAEGLIHGYEGASPAFKGLYGFPATLCTSMNEEVVHGIPSAKRVLKDGDVISIDVGVRYDGYYGDSAVTLLVGDVEPEIVRLLEVTREALMRGVEVAQPDSHLGDISAAIQIVGEGAGYSVVKELVGHGIGNQPHEEPQVPNIGSAGQGIRLRPGLVLAIEPMFNLGGPEIQMLEDGWTVVTADRRTSAHFEHTVAITEKGPRILTAVPSKAG